MGFNAEDFLRQLRQTANGSPEDIRDQVLIYFKTFFVLNVIRSKITKKCAKEEYQIESATWMDARPARLAGMKCNHIKTTEYEIPA